MSLNPLRARREARAAAATMLRSRRRLATEDVTVFGEELTALHIARLSDVLTEPMREDYETALSAYDDAKAALDAAVVAADLARVDALLIDGRFQLACVLARRDGRDLPQRRDPCFFNPQHRPAERDVAWAPPDGVERAIPVCFSCAERLAAGEAPDHRMVRVGDRWLRWYAAGGSPAAVAAVQAHVADGDAWHSRVNQAEALTRTAIHRTDGWGAGG